MKMKTGKEIKNNKFKIMKAVKSINTKFNLKKPCDPNLL
jgi:hypothetical protein